MYIDYKLTLFWLVKMIKNYPLAKSRGSEFYITLELCKLQENS